MTQTQPIRRFAGLLLVAAAICAASTKVCWPPLTWWQDQPTDPEHLRLDFFWCGTLILSAAWLCGATVAQRLPAGRQWPFGTILVVFGALGCIVGAMAFAASCISLFGAKVDVAHNAWRALLLIAPSVLIVVSGVVALRTRTDAAPPTRPLKILAIVGAAIAGVVLTIAIGIATGFPVLVIGAVAMLFIGFMLDRMAGKKS